MAESEIATLYQEHEKKVVFLDAAVLLAAKWHEKCCHQVIVIRKSPFTLSVSLFFCSVFCFRFGLA